MSQRTGIRLGKLLVLLALTTGVSARLAPIRFSAWPGGTAVLPVDGNSVFGGNLSGLIYESTGDASGVLWAVRNGPGTLFRLVYNGSIWTPDPANQWATGKALRYPNGTGDPDAEGVTFAESGPGGGVYVSTERDNAVRDVSRNAILRFDPASSGPTLTAAAIWDLTRDLPKTEPNLGIESLTWIPDRYLTSRNFVDETKRRPYNPADYPGHGAGLFFVGLEGTGQVYGYALMPRGVTARVATFATGLPAVMELQFDRDLNELWAVCDNTCQGRSVVLSLDRKGRFVNARAYERPRQMPDLNNEGFAFTPLGHCRAGVRPAWWADDGETAGHAIRAGSLKCPAAGSSQPIGR
jgi:hypothetical protein